MLRAVHLQLVMGFISQEGRQCGAIHVEMRPFSLGSIVETHTWRDVGRHLGAWWAAVYGVAESRTRLKRLSSRAAAYFLGFPAGSTGKETTCQCRRLGFNPWVRKIPWRKSWQPTLVCLPWEFHEQRSLVGYSPWGHKRVGHKLVTKKQTTRLCATYPGGPVNQVYFVVQSTVWHTFCKRRCFSFQNLWSKLMLEKISDLQ